MIFNSTYFFLNKFLKHWKTNIPPRWTKSRVNGNAIITAWFRYIRPMNLISSILRFYESRIGSVLFFFSFSGRAITYSQLKVNSGNRVFRLRRLDHREKLVHQREKSNSSLWYFHFPEYCNPETMKFQYNGCPEASNLY